MTAIHNILFISGSLRAESLNTKLLQAFVAELPESVTATWGDLDLPLYNEELEAHFPPKAEALREQVKAADAIVIATPEYNRAMTGALKNAIDWASRPHGDNAWSKARVLVVSASPGSIGGALALYQVKQSLLHVGAEVLAKPEFILSKAGEKFDESGALTDDTTREHITEALTALGV